MSPRRLWTPPSAPGAKPRAIAQVPDGDAGEFRRIAAPENAAGARWFWRSPDNEIQVICTLDETGPPHGTLLHVSACGRGRLPTNPANSARATARYVTLEETAPK